MHAGKTRSRSERDGLERPQGTFGRLKAINSGVAPAQHSVLPVSKSMVAPCATATRATDSRHPGVTGAVTQRVTCSVFLTVTAADHPKVTTGEGQIRGEGELADEVVDGWNGSLPEEVARKCGSEVEKEGLYFGVTKGLDSVEMVWRNHSESSRYLVPETWTRTEITGFLPSRSARDHGAARNKARWLTELGWLHLAHGESTKTPLYLLRGLKNGKSQREG